MKSQIVICEDVLQDREKITYIITLYLRNLNMDYTITAFTSGEALIGACESRKIQPHIIFMDIQLDGMNGIETATIINKIAPNCHIIYLSNHLQFATDVYTTEHRYYVLKSEFEQRIGSVFDKIFTTDDCEKDCIIPLKHSCQVVVNPKDIIMIERNGRGSKFFVKDTIYESTLPLKDAEALIATDSIVQCHNSFYINLDYIKSYEREQLELKNGLLVPISRKYQPLIRNRFTRWTQEHLFHV